MTSTTSLKHNNTKPSITKTTATIKYNSGKWIVTQTVPYGYDTDFNISKMLSTYGITSTNNRGCN